MVEPEEVRGPEIIEKLEREVGEQKQKSIEVKQNVKRHSLVGGKSRRYIVLKTPQNLTFGPIQGHFLSQGTSIFRK